MSCIIKTLESAINDWMDLIHTDPRKEEDVYFDYERDENDNLLSPCCGEILDQDNMICPNCYEHC